MKTRYRVFELVQTNEKYDHYVLRECFVFSVFFSKEEALKAIENIRGNFCIMETYSQFANNE